MLLWSVQAKLKSDVQSPVSGSSNRLVSWTARPWKWRLQTSLKHTYLFTV